MQADAAKRSELPSTAIDLLTVQQVAELLRVSPRTIYGLTRSGRIPHRRLDGHRRCLFVSTELTLWLDGATLEVLELEGGGRIVRPAKTAHDGRKRPERASESSPRRRR